MAGDTVFGRAFVDPIDVTALAGYVTVQPGQWERGSGVVEGGRLPALGVVAGGAVRAKTALVGVFGCMAGHAVTRRAFENLILMTLLARQGGMLPIQHNA